MKKLLALMIAVGMMILPVMAEDKEYEYTITVYAGNQGSFNGENKITAKAKYGDVVSISLTSDVLQYNDTYYPRGIKKAGRDNNDLELLTFTVTGDADYVVSYGMAGNLVKYTAVFQDTEGNEIAERQEFYGMIGDKPIVSFVYVPGYLPDSYNRTKTLSENEEENVFIFTYYLVDTSSEEEGGQTGGGGGGGIVVINGDDDDDQGGGNNDNNNNNNNGNNNGNNNNGGGNTGPVDIIDDDDPPLAQFLNRYGLLIGVGVVAVDRKSTRLNSSH